MKILVTGGTGYIGSHTSVELILKNHEVVIVDNLYNSSLAVLDRIEKISGVKPKFYQVDICDIEKLEQVFKENQFDACIHFAGYKAVGESVSLPLVYYQNNIAGSINLYRLLMKYNVMNLVFSSSATVYGDNFKSPLKESYGKGTTTNPYGETKSMNERIISDIGIANKDFSACLLRYFNPIGAHESGLLGEVPNGIPNNLIPYVARVANGTYDHLKVFGNDYNTKDGTGIRDYIHVVDLAKAHVLAIEYANTHKGVEVINIGTGRGYSVMDVIHAYKEASKKDVPYRIYPRRPGDIETSFADPYKAHELLGFQAQYDLKRMCEDTYRFYTMNPDGIK